MYVKDVINLLKPKYVRKKQIIKLNKRLNELLTKDNVKRNDIIKDSIRIIGEESNNVKDVRSLDEFNLRYQQLIQYLNSSNDFYLFLRITSLPIGLFPIRRNREGVTYGY